MACLFVVGATGATGREIVRQALESGHTVRALVRSRSRIDLAHERLTVTEGDVLDTRQLAAAMQGCDAVLSALGVVGRPRGPVDLCTRAGQAILGAMQETGIQRLVMVTAGAYIRSRRHPLFFRLVVQPIILRVLRETYADLMRLERLLESSLVAWTVVRPARLLDGPRHAVRMAANDAVSGGWVVSRASVAALMLDCVSRNSHVREHVAVAK